ncbi:MAG TPA: PQQ-binding-like beta-propeller repeat protein [Pirellulales bacterium]|nr:PQQ-binding-like beta-propeller repeat protein [Pirellulales bacterium]
MAADGGKNPGLSDPLIVDGLVVVGDDEGALRAFNSADGEEVWRYAHGARIYQRPDFDGKRIYAVSEEKGVVAVEPRNGLLLWEQTSRDGYGALAVCPAANLVFVAGNDGLVRALDASSGEERWATDIVKDAPRDPPGFEGKRARYGEHPARPTAAVCDDRWVFVSVFDQSRVVALDIKDGAKKFDYQTGGWVFHAAVVDDDRVFIGSQDRAMHCVKKETGEFLWSFLTEARIESSAAVDDGKVYFASCDGVCYCVDRESGEGVWEFKTDSGDGHTRAIYSDPLLLDDTVCFAAGEGQVYALELKTGALRWKCRPDENSELFCSPASDGRRVFVTSRPTYEKTGKAALIAIDPYFGRR